MHQQNSGRIGQGPAEGQTMQALEEKLAHMERVVDDLSDVIARQQTEITMLSRRVQLLMQREAERESETGSAIHLADQRPPHW